ncbi:MAG: CPBP family intramembrane metalloprotease [Actinobacteria bacterium]|nr:MAG: CPBP family intramembrane metalloprotease [Actinomycetota bacterium]
MQSFTHSPVETPKQISLQTHPAVSVLVIVGISVIGITPFAEEAFFRGFIFRRLGQRYRLGWAVVLSAAIFAVLHLIPFIMLPIFALGALLASIVYARKSLFPSVFAHMTFNAIGFTLQFIFLRK